MEREEDIKLKTWMESTETLLGSIDHYCFKRFSISMVPYELRKWSENAYKPKVISVGPLHKGATRSLQQMEETKWRCMLSLLHRTQYPRELLHKCMNAVLAFDGVVRATYVDEIKLDRYELATIMLNDSLFLLELLISGSKKYNAILSLHQSDHDSRVGKLEEEALTDLILLENQIPFFLLYDLAQLFSPEVFKNYEDGKTIFQKLAVSLLGFNPESTLRSIPFESSHFLELAYSCSFDVESPNSESDVKVIDVEPHDVNVNANKLTHCATVLQALGITIRSKCSPGISFNRGKGLLEIPVLDITKTTEARLRNFIAWEHLKMKEKSYGMYHMNQSDFNNKNKCKCIGDAMLFKGLICSASDVQLLKDKNVIVNHTNLSNRDLVTFFHSITLGIDPCITDSDYANLFHLLNTHKPGPFTYATQIPIRVWHDSAGVLTRFYLHYRRGYNIAISLISLLTFIQTLYAVMAYYDPPK